MNYVLWVCPLYAFLMRRIRRKYHGDSAGTLDNIGNLVRRAAEDWQLRRQLSQRAKGLVDGLGAKRLAEGMLVQEERRYAENISRLPK